MKIMESELRGKTVMSNEGGYLGILRAISASQATGDLSAIHVEPSDDVDARLFPNDGEGRMTFPFQSIKAVRDVVVVALN